MKLSKLLGFEPVVHSFRKSAAAGSVFVRGLTGILAAAAVFSAIGVLSCSSNVNDNGGGGGDNSLPKRCKNRKTFCLLQRRQHF
ncbi:MAG: hypothetical protein LBG72_03100 [Spirochaetaceae bacterium]|jgi:hypothetical protein|nr:hypothetical protein [Spirochaetaceae bacterium]